MSTNFQNQMCQLHNKFKDHFKINDQGEVSTFCANCVERLNQVQRPIIQLHHLMEFKNSFTTYVKGVQKEYENLQTLFKEITVQAQILKISDIFNQIFQRNQKYDQVAKKCEQGQNTAIEIIYKALAELGIKDDDIKQCNFQLTGFESSFKIIQDSIIILKRANEELNKLLPTFQQQNFIKLQSLQNNPKLQTPLLHVGEQKFELDKKNFVKQIGQDFDYNSMKINSLSLNETNQFLAIGADQFKVEDKSYFIQIWELQPSYLRQCQSLEGHSRSVRVVKFITESVLLSGGIDRTIIIWKGKKNFMQESLLWEKVQQLSGHTLCVNCLDFNILTNKIFSGSQEIIIWKEDYSSQSKNYVQRENKQMDEVIQFLKLTNNYQHLFAGNQNYIYLLEILNDNLVQIKKIQSDSNCQFQFLMCLDAFDFISFQKKEICFFEQNPNEPNRYNRKSINQEEEIKHVSFNYFKNLKIMSVCYSNNKCRLSQIQMDDNNSYKQTTIFECDGLYCQFGPKEPKFCVISKQSITMYTFRNI